MATEYVWLYLPYGKVTHAIDPDRSYQGPALCGIQPTWFRARWHGLVSDHEEARAGRLPRCIRCVDAAQCIATLTEDPPIL